MTYLCDSNVWLALSLSGHVHHPTARRWLDGVEDAGSVLFCRATQQTFLRLLTNAAVLSPYGRGPLTNTEAWDVYEALLSDDRIELWHGEPAGIGARWKEFACRDVAAPKLWMDAYLAAFAVALGCRLVSDDAAFTQFDGLDLLLLSAGG